MPGKNDFHVLQREENNATIIVHVYDCTDVCCKGLHNSLCIITMGQKVKKITKNICALFITTIKKGGGGELQAKKKIGREGKLV